MSHQRCVQEDRKATAVMAQLDYFRTPTWYYWLFGLGLHVLFVVSVLDSANLERWGAKFGASYAFLCLLQKMSLK